MRVAVAVRVEAARRRDCSLGALVEAVAEVQTVSANGNGGGGSLVGASLAVPGVAAGVEDVVGAAGTALGDDVAVATWRSRVVDL